MTQALWQPSPERINSSEMTRFQKWLGDKFGQKFSSYNELHRFSVAENEKFWSSLFEFFSIRYSGELTPVNLDQGFSRYGWFPNVSLNFAENLLTSRDGDKCALHLIHESNMQKKISYRELYQDVAALQGSLRGLINEGDVLAAYMPNIPETVVSMLATTALGGVFTSTSADFGIEGVVDRFGQSRPKVLVTVASYEYNGKRHSLLPKIKEIVSRLDFLEQVVVVDFLNDDPDLSEIPKAMLWSDFQSEEKIVEYTRVPFNSPLYIMYSSGTTGKPKCIVHSVGGTLLQHVKELGLHTNLTEDKSIFFFTTCGWMMWNWLVSSLFFGSRVCLYEGSPSYPSLGEYFKVIDREEINIFGTSPKFLRALEDSGYRSENDDSLSGLEALLSTGAPLMPDQFDYIYRDLKKDIVVSSISGGTDILGCFMLGNPNLPVNAGEIQCLGLGMDVDAFDSSGGSAAKGTPGELVCKKSFPSRPLYFLGDDDVQRIHRAYFSQFEGIWAHGDFVEFSDEGGIKVLGRSDATLNPGGVRIGTAEIYRQVEGVSWIEDCLCVGLQEDGDVSVVLFVKMANGEKLNVERVKQLKTDIRSNTTPRHVPKYIEEISDIPYTRSGKKMELAVTHILAGRSINNEQAVANPESLDYYRKWIAKKS